MQQIEGDTGGLADLCQRPTTTAQRMAAPTFSWLVITGKRLQAPRHRRHQEGV